MHITTAAFVRLVPVSILCVQAGTRTRNVQATHRKDRDFTVDDGASRIGACVARRGTTGAIPTCRRRGKGSRSFPLSGCNVDLIVFVRCPVRVCPDNGLTLCEIRTT